MPLTESEQLLFEVFEKKDQESRVNKLKIAIVGLEPENLRAKNQYGQSALMMAIENKDWECTRLLIEAKSDVNDRDCQGNTIFMMAVEKGDPNCILLLIDAKADINRGTAYFTPLNIAIEKENFLSVGLLMQHKVSIPESDPLLSLIVTHQKWDVLHNFLERYPKHLNDAVALLIKSKEKDLAKKFLEKGSQNNLRCALRSAMHCQELDLVCELLPRIKVFLRNQIQDVLQFASKMGAADLIKRVLVLKADVNYKNGFDSPLMVAAKNGDASSIKILVDAKAEVNKKTTYGTALFAAIQGSAFNGAHVLLEAKADPNQYVSEYEYGIIRGKEMSPLYWATKKGDIELVTSLIAYKADLSEDKMHEVWRVAALKGYLNIVLLLIQKKAGCNKHKVDLNFENMLTDTFDLSKRRAECIALIQNRMAEKMLEKSWVDKIYSSLFTPANVEAQSIEEKEKKEEKIMMKC